jgi:hypothetical protein
LLQGRGCGAREGLPATPALHAQTGGACRAAAGAIELPPLSSPEGGPQQRLARARKPPQAAACAPQEEALRPQSALQAQRIPVGRCPRRRRVWRWPPASRPQSPEVPARGEQAGLQAPRPADAHAKVRRRRRAGVAAFHRGRAGRIKPPAAALETEHAVTTPQKSSRRTQLAPATTAQEAAPQALEEEAVVAQARPSCIALLLLCFALAAVLRAASSSYGSWDPGWGRFPQK